MNIVRSIAWLLTSLLLFPLMGNSQVIIRNIDFNTDVPISVFNDCGDGTGSFGPGAGGWVINDMEGFNCDPNCGNNQGGDARNYFTTIDVDISGYCDVSVSATFTLNGDFECPPPAGCGDDFLQFDYTLDGLTGLFENNGQPNICICGNCSGNMYMSSTTTFVGNTVSITVTGGCQALSETITINEIIVEGFDQVIPQFPVYEACENDPPFLLETTNNVTGTFSGPGITGGNIFNPGLTGSGSFQIDFQPDPGQCASSAMTTVTVLTTPTANSAGPLEACEDGNTGQATFDLTSLNFQISGGSGTVNWFEDQNTTIPINNPGNYTSGSTTVYAQVDNGVCSSAAVGIALIVNDTPQANAAGPLEACDEGNNQATFDLTSLNNQVDPSGQNQVLWFQDQGGQIPISNPSAYTSFNAVVYAFVDNGQCRSEHIAVTLTVIPTETPQLLDAVMCTEDPPLDLTLLQDPLYPDGTWSGTNVNGMFFDPNGQEGTYSLIFSPNGTCVEDAMNTITVTESASPQLGTTTLCANDPLFDLSNLVDPQYPDGDWNGTGVTGNFFDPTGLNGDISIDFNASTPCAETASTIISVVQAGTPDLGDTTLCESNGLFDLGELEDPGYTGTWTGPGVNNGAFDPNGLTGVNNFTFTPDAGCADPAVATIEVFASSMSQPGDTTLCPGEDFLQLAVLADPAFPGSWDGPNVSNDTFFTSGLSGQVELQYIPVAPCVDTATVIVEVITPTMVTDTITGMYCQGQSVTINNVVYDENNPSGTDTLSAGAVSGCDSMVVVDLIFANAAVENIVETLCPGESLIINGTVYDENNLSGSDTLFNGSVAGCDSIINVSIGYYNPVNDIDQILCFGQQIVVNGIVYDENNPAGMEIIPNGSVNGCDSIINIDLDFQAVVVNVINETICPGESLNINGTVYDQNNPQGTDTIPNGSVSGCDSVLQVGLSFYSPALNVIDTTLCSEESLNINGTIYDQSNPNGAEVLPGASVNGCDSTIQVNLTFFPTVSGTLSDTLCTGDGLMVNGTLYDENNPTGTETLIGASANGCDSLLQIDLTFLDQVSFNLSETLCPGESLIINGTTYNESNPNGQEIFPGGSTAGCDSVVNIALSFFPEAVMNFSDILCASDSLIVQGTVFDSSNPTGSVIIPNASSNGCDSTVNVSLTFSTLEAVVNASPAGCETSGVGSIIIENITGTGPFDVSLDNGSSQPVGSLPFTIDSLMPGDYLMTIFDAGGCTFEENITIGQTTPGFLELGADITISAGGQIGLMPELDFIPITIDWDPSTDLSCIDCLDPLASPSETTIYTLTVSDQNGCVLTDDIQIIVLQEVGVFIPNVFSPDEDGINDRFTIFGGDELERIVEMNIYNRWGDLMYTGENLLPNDPSIGWNGTWRGKPVNPGVYAYWVRLELSSGEIILEKGDVTVVR